MKRTGGATLGTMVAWHLSTSKTEAAEEGEAGKSTEKWGMICTSPTLENSSLQWNSPFIEVPQVNLVDKAKFAIAVSMDTNKISDPPSTLPYNFCEIKQNASIKIWAFGASQDQFIHYFTDWRLTCDEKDGYISYREVYSSWDEHKKSITLEVGEAPAFPVRVDMKAYNGRPLTIEIEVWSANLGATFLIDSFIVSLQNAFRAKRK